MRVCHIMTRPPGVLKIVVDQEKILKKSFKKDFTEHQMAFILFFSNPTTFDEVFWAKQKFEDKEPHCQKSMKF